MRKLFTYLLWLLSAISCAGQQENIDSLLRLVPGSKDDTGKVKLLHMLSVEYENTGQYDSALIFNERAFDLASQLNYIKGTAGADMIAGNIHYYLGNYPEALRSYFAGMRQFDSTGYKAGVAKFTTNIGEVYRLLGDTSNAMDYFRRSLRIKTELHDDQGIAIVENNIGLMYDDIGKYDESLRWFTMASRIDSVIMDEYQIGIDLNNIGLVYFDKHQLDKAIKYYFLSVDSRKRSEDAEGLADTYLNLGNAFYELKRMPLAEKYIDSAKTISLSKGLKDNLRLVYSSLAAIDSAKGEFGAAYEHYKMSVCYADSLTNEQNTRETVQAQMQYDFDKITTAQRDEQERKSAIAEAEKKKQAVILWLVISGLAITLVFAMYVWRSLRTKQRINIEITVQKNLIEEKQKEILDSIQYAKRIQRSLLPSEKYIERVLRGRG